MASLKIYKALEDLFEASTKDADSLAAYYSLKNYLIGVREDKDKVVSNVPLILQKINRQGAYEYTRRTIES